MAVSKSQKLHELLRALIVATPGGGRLPSEPDLAEQLGVSRATLREAMRAFETQGMITRRQGAGTFVTHPSQVIDSGMEMLESIETLANRIGLQVSMGELSVDQRPGSPEELQALGLEAGATVLCLTRVILAEGRPVAYLVDILPQAMLSAGELEAGFTGSVLDLLLRRGSPPLKSSRCGITAVTATPLVARAMRIQRGDVLLCFEALLYSTSGQVVDYSYSYFLPGFFHFYVIRKVG